MLHSKSKNLAISLAVVTALIFVTIIAVGIVLLLPQDAADPEPTTPAPSKLNKTFFKIKT